MNRPAQLAAAAFGGTLALVLPASLAGETGLVVGATALSGLALVAGRRRLAESPPDRPGPATRPPSPAAPFPAYRRIESALFRSAESARHFDHAVRPLLRHVTAATLAERHGIDLAAEPDAARALLGPDLWPLVGPARPASNDSRSPGVDGATIARLLDRLEAL